MKKAHLSAFLALSVVAALGLGACASAGPSPARLKAKKAFEYNREVVVQVQVWAEAMGKVGMLGLGTGVYLGINGMVITNRHVVENDIPEELAEIIKNPKLRVCLVTEGKATACQEAEVVALSETSDLALIRTSLPDRTPIRIRPQSLPMGEAERVYARLSYRDIVVPSLVYGRYVGAYRDEDDGEVMDFYDLAAMPGGSGGPVFDLQGRLVGLAKAVSPPPGRSMTFVVPAKDIRKFLAEHPELFVRHEKLYP